MICPYCNQPTQHDRSYGELNGNNIYNVYSCYKHSTRTEFTTINNDHIEKIVLTTSSPIWATIILFPLIKKTRLILHNKISHKDFNYLLNICPDNIRQKLKTLITFS